MTSKLGSANPSARRRQAKPLRAFSIQGGLGQAVRPLLVAALLMPIGEVSAETTPTWLLGKSIELQWRLERSFEPAQEGKGRPHTDFVEAQASVYVSQLGRLFVKVRRRITTSDGGAASFATSKSPDAVTRGTDWAFQDGKLYGFLKMGAESAAAQRVGVQFDAASQSCSISVEYGRPHDAQELLIRGWTGADYYLRRYELVSSSCAVKSENVFAISGEDTPDGIAFERRRHMRK